MNKRIEQYIMNLSCIPSEIFLHQDMLEEVTCTIGIGVTNDPVALPCAHRFCRKCIEDWLDRNSICPTCRKPAKKPDLKPDEGVWKIICSFKVKCESPSCSWQGKYCEREMHIRKYCDFTIVQCDYGCGRKMIRKELTDHLSTCEFAPMQCPFCGISVIKAKMAEHKQECPSVLIECPNNCGKTLAKGQLKVHLDAECSEGMQDCKYNLSGCNFKGKRKDMEAHYKEAMEQHLDRTHLLLIGIMDKLQSMEIKQESIIQKQEEFEQRLAEDVKEEPVVHSVINPVMGSMRIPQRPLVPQQVPQRTPQPPKEKRRGIKPQCKPQ